MNLLWLMCEIRRVIMLLLGRKFSAIVVDVSIVVIIRARRTRRIIVTVYLLELAGSTISIVDIKKIL